MGEGLTVATDIIRPTLSDLAAVELIAGKIAGLTPFTLTRLGDGEAQVLAGCKGREELAARLCAWWGYKYPQERAKAIKDCQDVMARAFDSDVLGVVARETAFTKAIFERGRIPASFIKGKKILVCDHHIAQSPLLGNIYKFREILQGRDVHFITTRRKELTGNGIDRLLGVRVTYTDLHQEDLASHRPSLAASFREITAPVVLWANSAFGKDFGVYLRNAYGKICLDMGSTLDAWGGLSTRGSFRPQHPQFGCMIINGIPQGPK